ncbi:MAG TPA: hypothetical protein VHZ07_20730 [Bryobacteraceae bacterium]|jgi:ABC-type Mn2+/Zn2+ transport system ATPase subunit|nr:hypothetical protein [Bryobacteraceae bacterium]
MLTRIFIDNFLCFANFEYRPGRKQLLLGGNGGGKSSLLNAIRDLKQFGKGDKNFRATVSPLCGAELRN